MSNDLFYLATPYSLFPGGPQAAYEAACVLAADLMLAGQKIYCPVSETHGVAIHGGLDPLDYSIWLKRDEIMMARCDALLVAHFPGWENSYGIAHEVRFFEQAGKPIFDLDPQTMVITKR